jgi:hypothetical protein
LVAGAFVLVSFVCVLVCRVTAFGINFLFAAIQTLSTRIGLIVHERTILCAWTSQFCIVLVVRTM